MREHFSINSQKSRIGQVLHCYTNHPEIPNLTQTKKQTELFYLEETNFLFAAAKNCESTIFIENMEQVHSQLGDDNFSRQNYSEQKGLIQAHIFIGNELWGIIQASQFNLSRPWTRFDRSLISLIIDRITPLVSVYAKRELR